MKKSIKESISQDINPDEVLAEIEKIPQLAKEQNVRSFIFVGIPDLRAPENAESFSSLIIGTAPTPYEITILRDNAEEWFINFVIRAMNELADKLPEHLRKQLLEGLQK